MVARPEPGSPLAVTVLGSGGPRPTARRASAGYLLWVDGEPRVLVDPSGGVLERLAGADVEPAVLELVVLTHTHIDHSAGLAPVVFAAWLGGRERPLPVAGPAGAAGQPGCRRFCELLFGVDGAWRDLQSFEGFVLEPLEVPSGAPAPVPLWEGSGLTVRAVGVPHGMMPSVGYRFDHGARSVAFSGDLEGAHAGLQALARRCDVLVHDQALPRRDIEHGHLHPPPEDTAANAAGAEVGTLVLSHLMPPAEAALDDVVARVRAGYGGPVVVAEDLLTVSVGGDGTVTTS